MDNVKTGRDSAALSPKCIYKYHYCTLKAQGWMDAEEEVERLEEPGVVDDFKKQFPDTIGLIHI